MTNQTAPETNTQALKRAALAKFLDEDQENISVSQYDSSLFDVGYSKLGSHLVLTDTSKGFVLRYSKLSSYLVLTDTEADERARESILDLVWAFKPDFLESHTGVDASVFKVLQQKMYEDANCAILKLIEDKDHFVDDAILSDGRGHSLAQYDNEENEEGPFFIYRID